MQLLIKTFSTFITSLGIIVLLLGCSTTKTITDLNMHHPIVVDIVHESKILAIFCSDEVFYQRYYEQEPQPGVYLILDSQDRFLEFKTSYLSEYNKEKHTDRLNSMAPNWQNKLSNECGIGKKYPYIYWFTIKTTKNMPHDKDKQAEYLKNYEAFKQQILNNRSLTVSVSRPAFLIGENLIAETPSTLTFNEEQYSKLKEILEKQ